MATENKQSVARGKPSSNQDGSSKEKFDSSVKNKKIDSSNKHSTADFKPKSVSTVTKTEVKLKTSSSSSKTTTTKTKVREKKVFSLPGQKYDPPEEREPLRIFYESLSKQIPTSEMAEFWMMEHGLLSPERAKKAYEKKQRKQKMQRMGTPIKSTKSPSKPESSQKQQQQASKNGNLKSNKRIVEENDEDNLTSPKRRKM
ncbi:uncharacterized protein LOC110603803 [Manihot esculenta]|uniref:Uncharacterized protein n=1 Tax=Manihot esculenta TaxID=3983 RepID=A0A2C9UAM8_MANES|nr:uncharacterized protein LOC110603803 [Manihot esculenta]OAY26803.1 hypothetical protein MANES_16G075900v8 [Manihot esculenta]